MEQFNVIYLKLPMPGLDVRRVTLDFLPDLGVHFTGAIQTREEVGGTRSLSARQGLFITGGCFAYFVAFQLRS